MSCKAFKLFVPIKMQNLAFVNWEHCGVVICALDLQSEGRGIRIPLGAYALRQGILSTIVSLDPGVVHGYTAGIYSFECSLALKGCMRAKAGVIMPRAHRDAIWM